MKIYDLEELIRERSFQRRSMDWLVYLHEAFCWHCSPEPTSVTVGIIPFSGSDRELRARRADTLVINLALTVLKDAAGRASADDVNTPAVRLALRVLRPFLPDQILLVRFWNEAEAAKGKAVNESHCAHGWLVAELVRRGHSVWAQCLLE